jgi:hypothetical protein
MQKFSEWLKEKPLKPVVPKKLWKATKDEIIKMWQGLPTNTPILIKPINYDHKGSTYGEDGVRITGSAEFIMSVAARLKEFLQFENPNNKLQLVYKQTESEFTRLPDQEKNYVFYIQVKERGPKAKPDIR